MPKPTDRNCIPLTTFCSEAFAPNGITSRDNPNISFNEEEPAATSIAEEDDEEEGMAATAQAGSRSRLRKISGLGRPGTGKLAQRLLPALGDVVFLPHLQHCWEKARFNSGTLKVQQPCEAGRTHFRASCKPACGP